MIRQTPASVFLMLRTRQWLQAAILVVLGSPSLSHAQPLAGLRGVWQVEHVRNDQGATHRLDIRNDDPKLVGRLLDVSDGSIAFHTADGDESCASPTLSPVPDTAGALVAKTMAGRGAPPVTPLPQDYGLVLPPGAQVQVLWLRCRSGAVGPGYGDRPNTWFLEMPEHRVAMGYYGSTILILTPVEGGVAPRASFDCGRAGRAAEKAICASSDLAGFDSSVAASYRDDLRQFAATGDHAATAKLETSQKDWLRVRDRCGADAACLRKAMVGRLQAMANTGSFTGE